jgi:hypothetical protein
VHVCWGVLNRRRKAVADAVAAHASFAHERAPLGTLPREELWRRMARHDFVACVEGYGPDCHRTWEALALRCGVAAQDLPATRALLLRPRWPLPAAVVVVGDAAGGARVWAAAIDGAVLARAQERARPAAAAAEAEAEAEAEALSAPEACAAMLGAQARRLIAEHGPAPAEEGEAAAPGARVLPRLLRASAWVAAMRASARQCAV